MHASILEPVNAIRS